MKKKILAIDQGEHLGGAERFFAELLSQLPEYDIHLITTGNPEYEKLYQKKTVEMHRLELPKLKPIRFRNFINYKKSQKKIEEVIAKLQPDIILSNTVRTHLLISSLARQYKIPLVWMAHDRTFPASLLRWFIKYPQRIISCSRFVESFYKKQTNRKDIHWEVMYPFAIGPSELKQLKKIKKRKIIGMVGKFIPWKNQKTFIEVATSLHDLYPDYRFVIIGNAYEGNEESEQYLKACEKMLRINQLKNICTIKKKVPNALVEIASWEILVHCSKEPEPLGRVILEGMAAGCAVICSPFGGPAEVVQHRMTGVMAKPEEETLKREIKELLNYPEERENMVENAKKEIQEKYNWKEVGEKFKKDL